MIGRRHERVIDVVRSWNVGKLLMGDLCKPSVDATAFGVNCVFLKHLWSVGFDCT